MELVRNRRFWLMTGPSLALITLAVVMPDQLPFLAGAAAAWALAASVIFRSRERMEYQAAIRHMRRGNYAEAIHAMDALIQAKPETPEHRLFRAELYRLSGDLKQAAADYRWIMKRDRHAVAGYLGLAEIALQQGDYSQARAHALPALKLDKGWMAAYDLGLIEDRQTNPAPAIKYLETALASGIPHSRFRLLARLWLARNYHRQGRDDEASEQITLMRQESAGLREWQMILESPQGAGLQAIVGDDVQRAQQLLLLHTDEMLEALD